MSHHTNLIVVFKRRDSARWAFIFLYPAQGCTAASFNVNVIIQFEWLHLNRSWPGFATHLLLRNPPSPLESHLPSWPLHFHPCVHEESSIHNFSLSANKTSLKLGGWLAQWMLTGRGSLGTLVLDFSKLFRWLPQALKTNCVPWKSYGQVSIFFKLDKTWG